MKVRATRKGYYGLKIREERDEFDIQDKSEFSEKWMVAVVKGSPREVSQPKTPTPKAGRASDQSTI